MITGGLGALGILTAQWLVDRPHRRTGDRRNSTSADAAARAAAPPDLYLVSRTGRPDASALVAGTPLARLLKDSMGMVTILRADMAVFSEAAAALVANDAAPGRRPITSIVHASGVLMVRSVGPAFTGQLHATRQGRALPLQYVRLHHGNDQLACFIMQDGLLASQSAASTRAVFAPKVCGALRLAAVAATLPLRCVLLVHFRCGLQILVLQLLVPHHAVNGLAYEA